LSAIVRIVFCGLTTTALRLGDVSATRMVLLPSIAESSRTGTVIFWTRQPSPAAGLGPQAGNVRRPLAAV
jgi:hypothetical protein